jgi:hypothetical protein
VTAAENRLPAPGKRRFPLLKRAVVARRVD